MVAAVGAGVALILGVLVLWGGRDVPVQPAPEPAAPSPAQQAAALAERGDYEGARRLYQQALVAAPEDVSLWYGLGVALSNLNRTKETEEAFMYVVQRGRPDSEEVRRARQWLVSAGVLAPASATARETEEPPEAETAEARGAEARGAEGKAVLKGKVAWGAVAGDPSALQVRLLIQGVSGAGQGKRFTNRIGLGQDYRFERLPAGSYRLVGRVGDQLLWDLTVDVEEGRETTLDLSPENSSNPGVALGQ